MFKCQDCKQSGLRPNRVVVERKMVKHCFGGEGPRGGVGSQIVREVLVCDGCMVNNPEAILTRAQPTGVGDIPSAPKGEILTFTSIETASAR